MGIKRFLTKKLIGAKMKHLPKDQQDMILNAVTENPDFFKKIQDEIEKRKKQGQNEQLAMFQVMREHQSELQEVMMKYHQKGS